MIVLKFGGSSVDGAAGIERVVDLIRGRLPARPVIVVSAMAKTTTRLLEAGRAAAAGDLDGAREIAAEIAGFHARVAHRVTAAGSPDDILAAHFGALEEALARIAAAGVLSRRDEDLVAGFGELLSSAILALALRHGGVEGAHVDCRRVIVTDDRFTHAQPDYAETAARLRAALSPLLAAGAVPVLGGYVGATREGVTTTLGKEGSDFSAAIVGAALAADEVQIWTDVDGILSADPRLVPGARVVPALSFAEALELACSGSKKPHPGTLGPARRGNVPIRVLNSRNPAAGGSLIGRRVPPAPGAPPRILSIACRLADYPVFAQDGIPAMPGVTPGWAMISLVSEDLATAPELAERALAAAREHDDRPTLVLDTLAGEAACPAVRLLVDEAAAPRVVAELHARLIEEE